jgi:L-lactate dehydrogenase (cytochrome)
VTGVSRSVLYRDALNEFDLQEIARRRLPFPLYSYIEGGVEDNQARDNNRQEFQRIRFRPRSLIDVSGRSQAVEILGQRFDSPFGISPMGIGGVLAFEADLEMARAAKRMNVPFSLSAYSTFQMEEMIRHAPDGVWLQGYMDCDCDLSGRWVARGAVAGYRVLMISTDTQARPNRENNARSGFTLPVKPTPRLLMQGVLHPRWSIETFPCTLRKYGVPHFENLVTEGRPSLLEAPMNRERWRRRAAVDWELMRFIRDKWKGALLVKGTLHPADAEMAVRVGLDGVVLSNHGGRQLDGAVSPIEVLPDIRAAVGIRLKDLADSGFRRSTYVLKAVALEADFILLDRVGMFAVAAGGEGEGARAIVAQSGNRRVPRPARLPVRLRTRSEPSARQRSVSERLTRATAGLVPKGEGRVVKITNIHVFPDDGAFRDLVFVKVDTNQGIHGWGEAGGMGRERACAATAEELKPYFIGQDPGQIELLWKTVYRDAYRRPFEWRLPLALGSLWKTSPLIYRTDPPPPGWRRPW